MPHNFPGKQRRWIEGGLERVGKLGLRLGLMTIEGKMDQPWIQDLSIDGSWLALQLHTSPGAG